MTASGAWSTVGPGGRASSAAAVRGVHLGYPLFTDADEGAGALAAPPLLPLSYLVGTVRSARGLQEVLVFRDVARVTESVAAALGERQR